MSIIATLNGWNIIKFPTSPLAPMQIDWNLSDSIAEATSPFTQQSQFQQWAGADMISGSFSMPPMTASQLSSWRGFLMELAGTLNCFLLGDPTWVLRGNPQGSAPVVNSTGTGTNQPGQNTIVTRAWKHSQQNLLEPGDAFQVGYRLYFCVTTSVTSDASGNASITVWPSIRESIPDAAPLILKNPVGTFRLASSVRGWQQHIRVATVGLKFKEAK